MNIEEYLFKKKKLEKDYNQALKDVEKEYVQKRKDLFEEATNLKIGDVVEVKLKVGEQSRYYRQNTMEAAVIMEIGKGTKNLEYKCLPLLSNRMKIYSWNELEDIMLVGHIDLSEEMLEIIEKTK